MINIIKNEIKLYLLSRRIDKISKRIMEENNNKEVERILTDDELELYALNTKKDLGVK